MLQSGVRGALAVGDNRYGRKIAGLLLTLGFQLPNAVSPGAVVSRHNFGSGIAVLPGAVVNAGAFDYFAIVNTRARVDREFHRILVSRGPSANLAAEVRIRQGAFIGTGAMIIPRRCVGDRTVVGAVLFSRSAGASGIAGSTRAGTTERLTMKSSLESSAPSISVGYPALSRNENKYVNECLDSSWILSAGSFNLSTGGTFAAFRGARYALSSNNGPRRSFAPCCPERRSGDAVVVPTPTYIAGADADRYCGAPPVFVDSEPRTRGGTMTRLVARGMRPILSCTPCVSCLLISTPRPINPPPICCQRAADLPSHWPLAGRDVRRSRPADSFMLPD